jgi:hypothetical protein
VEESQRYRSLLPSFSSQPRKQSIVQLQGERIEPIRTVSSDLKG